MWRSLTQLIRLSDGLSELYGEGSPTVFDTLPATTSSNIDKVVALSQVKKFSTTHTLPLLSFL